MQSTLVMFHGKEEMARTVGDTDAELDPRDGSAAR